jgi:hypothetical protein
MYASNIVVRAFTAQKIKTSCKMRFQSNDGHRFASQSRVKKPPCGKLNEVDYTACGG